MSSPFPSFLPDSSSPLEVSNSEKKILKQCQKEECQADDLFLRHGSNDSILNIEFMIRSDFLIESFYFFIKYLNLL